MASTSILFQFPRRKWLSRPWEVELGSAPEVKFEPEGRLDPKWDRSGSILEMFGPSLLAFSAPKSVLNDASHRHANGK